jgi:hypothetical protein
VDALQLAIQQFCGRPSLIRFSCPIFPHTQNLPDVRAYFSALVGGNAPDGTGPKDGLAAYDHLPRSIRPLFLVLAPLFHPVPMHVMQMRAFFGGNLNVAKSRSRIGALIGNQPLSRELIFHLRQIGG